MSRSIKHIVEYVLFAFAAAVVRFIPLSLVHIFGYILARWAYPFLKSRRNVALENLRYAFPEMDESERKSIALQSFQSVSATFIELLWYPNFSKESIRQRVQIENIDLLTKLLEKNKGIVFVTAHLGSWELTAQAIAVYSGIEVSAIAKTQSNSFIDHAITKRRELFGVKVVSMGINVREILRTLHHGGIVTLVADQSAPKESIAVEFFGRTVPTFQGPAMFSLKTGAPLLLGCAVRQKSGNYTMRFIQVPTEDLHDASDDNVYELTRRQVAATETIIREHPEQWMWMHKRWKHALDDVGE